MVALRGLASREYPEWILDKVLEGSLMMTMNLGLQVIELCLRNRHRIWSSMRSHILHSRSSFSSQLLSILICALKIKTKRMLVLLLLFYFMFVGAVEHSL